MLDKIEKTLSTKQMLAVQDSLTESWWVLNWAGRKNCSDRKKKMMRKYKEWLEVREKVGKEMESWTVISYLTLLPYSAGLIAGVLHSSDGVSFVQEQ